ncbi:MAG: hypothetical protein ISR57_05740 [Bacteroidales bacterium]|nr:hypothetical protein [Bacteroidota bacterium]MBL6950129.1 hypothetical protein [Bacteroidales bacterium]
MKKQGNVTLYDIDAVNGYGRKQQPDNNRLWITGLFLRKPGRGILLGYGHGGGDPYAQHQPQRIRSAGLH